MQFTQNAAVYSADGREVGRIDRVVIDPRTKEVTNLVIRQGVLLTDDKVIPISLVTGTTDSRVELRAAADDLRNLQNYQETYYVASDNERDTDYPAEMPLHVYAYPPVAGTALGGLPVIPDPVSSLNPDIAHSETNIPEDTVALKEGARVMSNDDQHVGNVDRVFTAADSGNVSHFLISQGLLFRAHKLIPVDWVDGISEDEVRLAVNADFLQTLRDYQPS